MKRIPIRQAIINAVEESDNNLSRYPNQALKWAKYIEREIGSALGYKIKSKMIQLTGCYLDIPGDCYHVMGVFPGDWEDQCNIQYRNITNPLIQTDTRTGQDVYGRDLELIWQPAETTWLKEFMWEEIADQLHMIQQFEDQEMTIVYQYIETDDKGYWMVNESHIDAITKYILFKYAGKYRWKYLKGDKLLRQSHLVMVEDLKRDYNQAVRHARAEDGKESPFEQAQY